MRVPHLLVLVAVMATGPFAAAENPSEPNVFLITIDTLRADHLHCYGYKDINTPAIDSLARDGIRFEHAFTPTPITNSSHATILTGLLPSVHGVTDFGVPLSQDHKTWAELLKNRGYHTAAFIGSIILDSNTLAPGLNRGFDFYDNFPEHSSTKSRWGRVERRGVDVATRAQVWLEAHPRGAHFVWVHLYDPHDPYEPPARYFQKYKGRPYDGEIAYADTALGNFLGFVKRHSWYKNALIVVVGDHGESLGEHGEDTHGIFLYDSTTHVPLIVKLPANSGAGTIINAQVRTTDILPTVLGVLSIPIPEGLNGESLSSYLTANDNKDRTTLAETDYPLRFGWAPLRSVRTPESQFIEAPRPELYRLKQDPGELRNEYAPWDKTVQDARTLLADLRRKFPDKRASDATVPEQTVEELKALGYLGHADVGSSTTVPEPSLLPDPKDRIQEANLLHHAMMASEDNRLAEARASLEKVLALDPNSPTGLRQLGEVELDQGDYSIAAEHLKAARALRPNDSMAAWLEGRAREKTGDYAESRDALQASLQLNPGQLQARLLLGDVYLKLKDFQAAEDQFEAASLIDANATAAKLGLARAELAMSKPEAALTVLEAISGSEPRNPDVFEVMADALQALGRQKESDSARARARSLRKK